MGLREWVKKLRKPSKEKLAELNEEILSIAKLAQNDRFWGEMGEQIDAVSSLIAQGANPNIKYNDGTPVLLVAVQNHNSKLVKILLDNGAEVNAIGPRGLTALHCGASQGDLKCIKLLIAAGAQINARAEEFDIKPTPLAGAVQNGHYEAAKLLIDAGADIETAVTGSAKLIDIAKHYSKPDIVALLDRAIQDQAPSNFHASREKEREQLRQKDDHDLWAN